MNRECNSCVLGDQTVDTYTYPCVECEIQQKKQMLIDCLHVIKSNIRDDMNMFTKIGDRGHVLGHKRSLHIIDVFIEKNLL